MRYSPLKTTLLPLTLAAAMGPSLSIAQMDPYVGQLMLTAANFCPTGWVQANGQTLPISQYQALFSLLSTTYGGDAVSFKVPDLQGRVPIQIGQGSGLSPITQGETGGNESATLAIANLPAHSHTTSLPASTRPASYSVPLPNRVLARSQNAGVYADGSGTNTTLGSGTTGSVGTNQAVPIRNPYLGMLWCIAITGIYPTRP